jgi:hypothetical protein
VRGKSEEQAVLMSHISSAARKIERSRIGKARA